MEEIYNRVGWLPSQFIEELETAYQDCLNVGNITNKYISMMTLWYNGAHERTGWAKIVARDIGGTPHEGGQSGDSRGVSGEGDQGTGSVAPTDLCVACGLPGGRA